jgi:hypothetical protein
MSMLTIYYILELYDTHYTKLTEEQNKEIYYDFY